MRHASKFVVRSRVPALAAAALILFSTAAPAAYAGLALVDAAPVGVGAAPPLAYAHQVGFLQNPIQDPGFELAAPVWETSAGASVRNGAAYLPADGSLRQSFPAASDGGSGVFGGAGVFVNGEALVFRASGNASVTLEYLELPSGQTFTALSTSFASEGGVVRFPIPQSPRLAQSSPSRVTFVGGEAGATVDDVVLEGVEYGSPLTPIELDDVLGPLPPEGDAALATLQDLADEAGLGVDLADAIAAASYAHDGYSLVILPLDFTLADGGADGILPQDPQTALEGLGTWRFAVFLAEYGPSGTRLLSADSLADARLLLNTTPTLAATGTPASPRQLITLGDTAWADAFPNADPNARGVVFRTSKIEIGGLSLIGVWNTPADEGGLYDASDARGFFHPAKLAVADLPIGDAIDVVAAPVSGFALGVVPCEGADGLTFRFGNLDCDADADLAEFTCSIDTSDGIGATLFTPDPLDSRTNCLDLDGDGLMGNYTSGDQSYDPEPGTAGNLTVDLAPDANGDWWRGVRSLDYTINNTYNGNNTDTPLTIRTVVVFQTADDEGVDGMRVLCDADQVTSAPTIRGTCYFNTTEAVDGADYRVQLVAEVLQPPYSPPQFGDELGRRIGVDNTNPNATKLNVTGTPGLNGWYVTPINVAFEPSDAPSGVERVDCGINGALIEPCVGSLLISAPGQTDLAYRAVDNAGNEEPTNGSSFFLSLTDPTVGCASTTAPLGENGWHLSAFDIGCTNISDTASVSTKVSLDGAPFVPYTDPIPNSAAGDRVLRAQGTDLAGRESGIHTFHALLDLDPPATTLDINGTRVSANLYRSDLSIGFNVTDDASGLARTLVSLDGAAPIAFLPGERLNVATDGNHTLTYRSIDVAGRSEAAKTDSFIIDREGPRTIRSINGTLGLNAWYRSNLTVTFQATDDTSSVADIICILDGAAAISCPPSGLNVNGDGRHTVEYYAVDSAGNHETPHHFLPLKIDTTDPIVALSSTGTVGLGGWYLTAAEVTVNASDATSGLDGIVYLVGGSGYTPYTGPFNVTDQGLTAVSAYATDLAGNQAPVNGTQIKIDSIDPVTTPTLAGTNAANGWFKSAVSVTLAASDSGSGISHIDYSLDEGAFETYTGTFTVSGELNHTLRTRAYDVAGNAENDTIRAIPIDSVAPAETTLSVNGTLGNQSWYTSPVTLTFTAGDPTSDVEKLFVSTNGGLTFTPFNGAGPHPITLSTDGTYALVWQARDLAGHNEVQRNRTIKVDVTAPKTTNVTAGTSGFGDWFIVAPVSLTLTATDATAGSTVDHIEYRIDDGVWQNYTTAITFSADGVYNVDFRAADKAGNVEIAQRRTIMLDTIAPTTTNETSGPLGSGGWYTGDVRVFLNASDATSGPLQVQYSADGVAWTNDSARATRTATAQNETRIYYRGADVAGNVAIAESVSVRIDRAAPTTTLHPAGTVGTNGYYTSVVLVTLAVQDGPSGASTVYKINGGNETAYTGPFNLTTQGPHTVAFRSTSGAGLVEPWNSSEIRIDLQTPFTQASLGGTLGGGDFYRTNVTVTLTYADNFSGVAITEYSLNSIDWTTYASPFIVSTLNGTTVSFRSTDNASLIEPTRSVAFRIDTLAPNTTATATGTAGNASWFLGTATVTLSAISGPSGVANTAYAINGTNGGSYTTPLDFSGEGVHTLTFNSTSIAGITEETRSRDVKVDLTKPVSTVVASGTIGSPGYYTSLVTLNLTATDATSGVELIQYRVNNGSWTLYESNVTPVVSGAVAFDHRATDVAGNVEAFQTLNYFIDSDVPMSYLFANGTAGDNGWFTSPVNVALTASAGPSGVNRSESSDNGAPYANYTGAFNVSGQGPHALAHRAVSNAGLIGDGVPRNFSIDTIAPATGIAFAGTQGSNGYFTSAVNITLTPSDATSGVNFTRFKIDAAADWTLYGGSPIRFDGPSGTHTILVQSRDLAGNWEVAHSANFTLDIDAITTFITPTGTAGDAGWFIGNVSVNLTATGGPSGIALTQYRIGSGAWINYTGNFTIGTDGMHVVTARSQNGAGVVEEPKMRPVNLDKVAPATQHALSGATGLDNWFTSAVTLSLTSSDATSGVRATQVRHNGGNWTPNNGVEVFSVAGHHLVEFRSIDHAGLVENATTVQFKIDGAAPTTTRSVTGTLGAQPWYTTPVEVALASTAGPSNVSGIYYRLDGGALTLYAGPIPIGDGVHTLAYNATSGAGVNETITTDTFHVDTIRPVSTIGIGGTLSSGWYVTNVTVFVNTSEATSGLATREYRLNDGNWTPYTSPFLISAQGTTTIHVRSTDNASNAEAPHNRTFQIDTAGPTVDVVLDGTLGTTPWYTSQVGVNVTASDATPGSGVASIQRDGVASPSAFVIATDGTTTHVFHAVDVAGNVGPSKTVTIDVDRIVPETTNATAGTAGLAGWYTSNATVTLSNATGPSGPAATTVTLDGGGAFAYAGPFPVEGDGTHTLSFATKSVAGLVEATQTRTIRIDTTAPTATIVFAGTAGTAPWFTSESVNATIMLTDATSGAGTCTYTIDGGADQSGLTFQILGEGNHTVTFVCKDVAGIANTLQTRTVRIDVTPPTVAAAITTGTLGNGGTYVSNVTVTITPSEATSGIARIVYSLNGGAETKTSGAVIVSDQGLNNITYRAIDNAGLTSSSGSLSFRIDSFAPGVSIDLAGTTGDDDWYTTSVSANVTATDAGTGVESISYSLDGSAYFPCGCPLNVSSDGNHTLNGRATDAAGNVGSRDGVPVKIDTVPPTTNAKVTGTQGQNDWFIGLVTLEFTASDALSGVRRILVNVDGEGFVAYAGPVQVASDGAHTVQYRGQDVAGNLELVRNVSFKIDATAPSVPTVTLAGTPGAQLWYTSPVSVTMSATDATSGVSEIRYRLGEGAEKTYTGTFTVNAEGVTQLRYRAIDNASTSSSTKSQDLSIDTQKPTTTNATAGTRGLDDWYTSRVTVTLTGQDPSPGSGNASTRYVLDGGAERVYTGAFEESSDGSHVVTYWSLDTAGNQETTKTLRFKIDSSAPDKPILSMPPPVGSTIYTDPVNITVSAADQGSGIARIEFSLNGGAWTTYSGPVAVATSGDHVFQARAVDRAGLVGEIATRTFTLDVKVPTLSLTPYRTSVVNSTPEVRAIFGPVFAGWDATRVSLKVDGAAAPRCEPSVVNDSLVVSCTPVTWKEAFSLGTHGVVACAATKANKVWCSDALLTRGAQSPWIFEVKTTDWDRDGYSDNREGQDGSDPLNPYSVPFDPQGWNLRQGPNDPTSALVASESLSLKPAQGYLKATFSQFVYASDAEASFAPNRTAALASLERLAIIQPTASQPPSIGVRPSDIEAASVTLGSENTTIRAPAAPPIVVPVRAIVSYETTPGPVGFELRANGCEVAELRIDNASTPPVTATIYAPITCASIASFPLADTDNDTFPDDAERLLGSDPGNTGDTPVPGTDSRDDYSVVLQPQGTIVRTAVGNVSVASQPALVVTQDSAFRVRLHVDDLRDAGRSVPLAGRRIDFAVVPLNLTSLRMHAPTPEELPDGGTDPLFDTSVLSPASDDPRAVAVWNTSCIVGDVCPYISRAEVGDDEAVIVTIPSDRVAVGPYVLWARVDLPDRGGVNSSAGYYNAGKALAYDQDVPVHLQPQDTAGDALDDAPTPVLFVSIPTGNVLGNDADDDKVPTLTELQQGSDPFDPASVPTGNDDGDGCVNRDERIPSWLMATAGGCEIIGTEVP